MLGVLGDPMRRTIVEQLAERPCAVGQLAALLPISRPAVSQHLRVLKHAGLVIEQPVGTRRIYRLDPIAVAALRDQLATFWDRALSNYSDVVDQDAVDQDAADQRTTEQRTVDPRTVDQPEEDQP